MTCCRGWFSLGLLLVGTALVSTAVAELRILLNELVHRRAMDQLLEAATTAELEAFEDPEFHDQVERAREHADTYAWQVVWGLVTLLSTLLSIVAVVAVLLTVAPLLVPVVALAYVPIAVVGVRNTQALYRLRYGLAELDRDRAYHERLLTGRLEAKEVRAFGLADWLRRGHDRLFDERVRHTRLVVAHRTALALLGSSVTALITVSALAAVMLLALDDRISVADAAVAIVSLQQISGRLRSLGCGHDIDGRRGHLPAGLRVLPARGVAPARPTTLPPSRPAHRASSASSTWVTGTPPARATPSSTSICSCVPARWSRSVGPNGAGKSTLAKLLCGLHSPTTGSIYWNDIDAAECDPAAVRALVAPVFQDFARFEHSVQATIGFGDLNHVDDRSGVRTAAQRAGADGFLQALPAGYDTRLSTVVHPGGTELSVGEEACCHRPGILPLTPPWWSWTNPPPPSTPWPSGTSSNVSTTSAGTGWWCSSPTASRHTVRRADRILVLLDAGVAEEGTHEELMTLGAVGVGLSSTRCRRHRSPDHPLSVASSSARSASVRSRCSSPWAHRRRHTGTAAANDDVRSKDSRVIAAGSSARWNPCSVMAPTASPKPIRAYRRPLIR